MNSQMEDGQYFKKAFEKLNSMRKNNLYCDVTLISKDMEIRAHKNILVSCSEFLKAFFEMKEENQLNLSDIEGKILLVLINYIYTTRIDIEISTSNVKNLLIGANILQLKGARKECCKYLENNLNINTSLNIHSIAQDQNDMDLLNKTEAFIDKNFFEIMKTQEFLNLSIDKLTGLISKGTLEVPSEENFYEGIISWIKNVLTTRTKYLSILVKHVRLTLIHRDYLTKEVINQPLVINDTECKNSIINALLSEKVPEMNTFKTMKRVESSQVLLIMGGDSKEARDTFEFFDVKTNRRSQIYTMPSEAKRCSLTVVNGKIYVVGQDYIKEYDLANNCWSNSINVDPPNSCYGSGILNDCIYTSNGKFDISGQKWSSTGVLALIPTGRLWPSVEVGDLNPSYLKAVELYDLKLNVWKRCSNLITGRFGAAVGILHNKMYVIGGTSKHRFLNSVECYSPEVDKFTQSAPLNFARHKSTAVEFNNKLYVIGGRNESGELDTIEVYCPKINKWELLPTTMNLARFEHGAVIINKKIEF